MQKLLGELADLLERHGAELSYTTDDDGVHVSKGGQEFVIPVGQSPKYAYDIAAPHAGWECDHMITQGHKCVRCGRFIYAVEPRKCGECEHFKIDTGTNVLGGCFHHNMKVISTMKVTFKVADGTCFTENGRCLTVEIDDYENKLAQVQKQLIDKHLAKV